MCSKFGTSTPFETVPRKREGTPVVTLRAKGGFHVIVFWVFRRFFVPSPRSELQRARSDLDLPSPKDTYSFLCHEVEQFIVRVERATLPRGRVPPASARNGFALRPCL